MYFSCSNGFRNAFLLPTILGSFPLTFEKGEPKLSIWLVFYGLMLRIVFGLVFMSIGTLKSMPEVLFVISYDTVPHLSYMFTLWAYLRFLFKNSCFKSILNTCTELEREMFKFSKVEFSGLGSIVYSCLSLLCLAPVLSHWYFLSFTPNLFPVLSLYSYLNLTLYMIVYPFVRMVGIIRQHFRNLNETLLLLSRLQCNPQKCLKIVNLTKLHCRLYDICRLLNKCFNQELVFFYFLVFMNVEFGCYYVINAYLADMSIEVYILNGIIVGLYFSMSYFLAYQCQNASKEAKKFTNLLYQVMIEDETNVVSCNKKLRLHISVKRDVLFTACGFFTIDYALLYSMIGAITVYLAVLIQFGSLKPPEQAA